VVALSRFALHALAGIHSHTGQIKPSEAVSSLPRVRPHCDYSGIPAHTAAPFRSLFPNARSVFAFVNASSYCGGMTGLGRRPAQLQLPGSHPQIVRRLSPDYRESHFGKGCGPPDRRRDAGMVFRHRMIADAVYVSRVSKRISFYYGQRASGYGIVAAELSRHRFAGTRTGPGCQSLDWANVVETGPGVRFRWAVGCRGQLVLSRSAAPALISPRNIKATDFFGLVVQDSWYGDTRSAS